MASRIEDYAMLGNCRTAALVSREGSIDWLCFPRFDSPACFAALLGTPENGRWSLRPVGPIRSIKRAYLEGTLILETVFETDTGVAKLIDFMPISSAHSSVARMVVGLEGRVDFHMELIIRFGYGRIVPWLEHHGQDCYTAVAGPDMLVLRTNSTATPISPCLRASARYSLCLINRRTNTWRTASISERRWPAPIISGGSSRIAARTSAAGHRW
jgi:GH15 family glucan-1,4-alpha-glucosidase